MNTRRQRGFTVLEAMVAAAILSIGLFAAVKMMTNMGVSSQLARQRMVALNYATNQLETLRAQGTCTALSPTKQPKDPQATTEYTMQVTCGTTNTDVIVKVTWNDSRGGHTLVGGADNQVVIDSQL